MEKILISGCLLGAKVRYHGGDAYFHHSLIEEWLKEGRLISLCPEVAGGASMPRSPSEIVGLGGGISVLTSAAKIKNKEGVDVTSLYMKGANIALGCVKKNHIKIAIFKDNSPSCGSHFIYDGTFSHKKIMGMGVTATLLAQHGVKIFNENQIDRAHNYLCNLQKKESKVKEMVKVIEFFETSRLQAKKITAQDFDLLRQMHTDPMTMETLGGVRTKEQTLENLQWNIKQWEDNSFGLWIFYEKEKENFIGVAGLRRIDIEGIKEVELAYILMSQCWGKGYATEMGNACLEIAFDTLNLENIIAKTRESNFASQRVIHKLGFSLEKSFYEYGHRQLLYRLNGDPRTLGVRLA